jgi:hypothetical protein
MAMDQTHHKHSVCSDQQAEEWAKLIRKLRWIGMEQEAHHLQMAVCRLPPHERFAVLTGPFSTD